MRAIFEYTRGQYQLTYRSIAANYLRFEVASLTFRCSFQVLCLSMICTLLALLSYIAEKMAGNQERTYIMIKPDGVQRGLVGEIIKRFEVKGFKLVALKFTWVS